MPKNNVYEEFVRLLLISEEEYEKPEILKFPEIPPIKSLGLEVKNTFFPLLPSCYLAHGSYGSCPSVVLDYYQAYQVLIEKNPTLFYHSKLYPLLAYSIRCLASYLDVNPRRLVLVKNVEVAITTVLKMYPTTICFDISYAAVQYSVSKHSSLEICILSRPITTESIISDFKKFIKELSGRNTGLVLLEHITSPTAILIPIKTLTSIAHQNGFKVLIDGAHAIGQVEGIQGDYHTSNLHKWFCAPRGVAYLYVQEGVSEPEGLVTTWGDEYGMHGRFVWQGNLSLRIGTDDYSGYLTIPFLINLFKWFDGIHEGGYKQRNIDLCQYGRDLLTCAWNTKSLVDRVECAMCSILLPEIPGKGRQPSQEEMRRLDKVHLPNFLFDGKRYVRISCHVYNTKEDLQLLRDAVLKLVMDLSEEI